MGAALKYQSVGPESDIDIILITDASFETKERVQEISYDIDLENGILTQLVFFTVQGFEKEVRMRSWFSDDVITQGIVLYDDGTYQRICQKSPRSVAGVPRR